jgi:uncharacterized surface protein with fasciclin (FAS1) repeats
MRFRPAAREGADFNPETRRTPMRSHSRLAAVLLAALAMLAVTLPSAVARPAAKPAAAQKNIVQTAVAAGKFKTLVSLVKQAGLAGTLQGKGPFTVFAPTDAAFAKVPKSTLEALAKNKSKLRAVLLYHVASGKLTASKVVAAKSVKTLEGASLRVRSSKGAVTVAGARVVAADVTASNGVIHVIDKVLIPPR